MSDITIHDVRPDSPHLDAVIDLLNRQHASGARGPVAPTYRAEVVATWSTRESARWMAAAVDGAGTVIGAVSAEVLREGNDHLVDSELAVAPSHRRNGLGREMWQRLLAHSAAQRADTVLGYSGRPVDADIGWRLIDEAGADPERTVNLDVAAELNLGIEPGTAFARAMGATQGQVEMHSRLDLPCGDAGVDWAVLDATLAPLEAEVARHASKYEVSTYLSAPDERYMAGLIELSGRMTVDPPFGDLDIRPDVRSRDRFDEVIAVWQGAGRIVLGAIAVELATGDVAAFSELLYRPDDPQWGDQHDTIVDPDHRGHRLGFAVKIAALRRFIAENPAARYIETYNAMENGPMFAVNRALGFEPVAAMTIWQYKITP